jgi:hypothetical protein
MGRKPKIRVVRTDRYGKQQAMLSVALPVGEVEAVHASAYACGTTITKIVRHGLALLASSNLPYAVFLQDGFTPLEEGGKRQEEKGEGHESE